MPPIQHKPRLLDGGRVRLKKTSPIARTTYPALPTPTNKKTKTDPKFPGLAHKNEKRL